MENKTHKPQVFPSLEQQEEANAVGTQLALNKEQGTTQSIPDPIGNSATQPQGEIDAAEQMRRNTAQELALRNHALNKTAEIKDEGARLREEMLRQSREKATREGVTYQLPEEHPQHPVNQQPNQEPTQMPMKAVPPTLENQGAMSYEEIAKFQKYMDDVQAKQSTLPPVQGPPANVPPVQPPSNVGQPAGMTPEPVPNDVYIEELSQPQMNCAFDVIPLPSEGKLYPSKKKAIKVAYMTTADENILTSPNLLNSGQFLEILFNRKILESDLRYRDLIEGDRDAIMLWLRATGYGNMYPIVVEDENGKPFETDIDLNEMKTINLNVEPDQNGCFTFKLPVSGHEVKFKLLTIGEVEHIGETIKYEIETLKLPIDNTNIYTLQKQIVSINGETNPEALKPFVENMRIGDSRALNEFIESINCGVDMNITVGTPGGGSISTFLPLNVQFFWPNL